MWMASVAVTGLGLTTALGVGSKGFLPREGLLGLTQIFSGLVPQLFHAAGSEKKLRGP